MEWKDVDIKIINELFNDVFDESHLNKNSTNDYQYSQGQANHYGGRWQDYLEEEQLFNLKIEMLEDLGYSPTDLI
jgi:hypothetical protein